MTMETLIKNHSNGNIATVTDNNQLLTQSESISQQHFISRYKENAYQVIGDFASVNNSTHTILHLKNDDPSRLLVVSYIRLQYLDNGGGTSVPSVNTYFSLGFGRTISSGGTAVTPVNMNRLSGKVAVVTATDNNPTMAGTFTEFDRRYIKAEGDEYTYNKEGSLILGLNDTLEIRITSDHTSGVALARVTFMMIDI